MSENSQYIISFSGLSIGEHEFKYNIDDTFFKEFEFSEIHKGDISVVVNLQKQSSAVLLLQIHLTGYVNVTCDRCAENFDLKLETSRQLIFKLGGNELIEEEEIIYLPASEHEIDLKQHLYESVIFALPLKRIHPEDAKGKSECNPDVLKKLKELSAGEEEEEGTDPRWAALKNIKIN